MNTKDLKIKPIERDSKIKVPNKLDSVETSSKPIIKLNFSDYINKLTLWLRTTVMQATKEIIGDVIPSYFWLLLIGVIILVLILKF